MRIAGPAGTWRCSLHLYAILVMSSSSEKRESSNGCKVRAWPEASARGTICSDGVSGPGEDASAARESTLRAPVSLE